MAKKRDCQHEHNHHSVDRVSVYMGRLEPIILCGYHAETIRSMAALKPTAEAPQWAHEAAARAKEKSA